MSDAPTVPEVLAKMREQLPGMMQRELLGSDLGLSFETALEVARTLRDVVLDNFIASVTIETKGNVTVIDHRTTPPA